MISDILWGQLSDLRFRSTPSYIVIQLQLCFVCINLDFYSRDMNASGAKSMLLVAVLVVLVTPNCKLPLYDTHNATHKKQKKYIEAFCIMYKIQRRYSTSSTMHVCSAKNPSSRIMLSPKNHYLNILLFPKNPSPRRLAILIYYLHITHFYNYYIVDCERCYTSFSPLD